MLTETYCVGPPRSIVTDHYLLDPEGVLIPDSLGPANNCQFRMILKIILKKRSLKRQASSSKQRLTAGPGYDRMYLERNNYE